MSRTMTVCESPDVHEMRATRSYLDWSYSVMVKDSSKRVASPPPDMMGVCWFRVSAEELSGSFVRELLLSGEQRESELIVAGAMISELSFFSMAA